VWYPFGAMQTAFTVGGSVHIRPNLILAPMAGVTDSPFRRLIKELGGVGLIVTEFISIEGLTRGNLKTHRMLRFLPEERPISIQIFGYDEERMRMAAEVVEEVRPDILDVNCGCPAKRVVRGGGGSNLLKDLTQLEKILRTVRKAISIPLTVKIRIGYYDNHINAVEVAKLVEDCGAQMLAVHGRTKEQGYKGWADWDVIAQVKQSVSIPVVGSGDVVTVEGAVARLRETGVDAVMIGRGAIANPFIFRQTEAALYGLPVPQPTPDEKYGVLLRYYELIRDDLPEKAIPGKLKQLCNHFTKGLPGGAEFREQLLRSPSVPEMLERLEVYFTSDRVRQAEPIAFVPDAPSEDSSCDMYE
jgi:tRNA-dihydrouridine synthase B